MRPFAALALLPPLLLAALEFLPPAENLGVKVSPGSASVLPGGRVVTPLGRQLITGPGAFGIAVSPGGRYIVSANLGPSRASITVVEKNKAQWTRKIYLAGDADREEGDEAWTGVSPGLAFLSERDLLVSDGNSGRVRRVDVRSGKSKLFIDLNQEPFRDSYTGDLAIDRERELLYVVDQANYRVAVVDASKRRILSSVRVGRRPFAAALSPDGKRLWVTNVGMLDYKLVPGADPARPRETGLPFPVFAFPSPEAVAGMSTKNGAGAAIDVPGLGDPNAPESSSVAVGNVENASQPGVVKFIRTGLPTGKESAGGSSPSGITLAADRAFVSNSRNDSIAVIDTRTLQVEKELLLRIPRLENYRGLLPVGSAYHRATGWLFVAAAGANALAVIDTKRLEAIGYLPTGWFPAGVVQQDEMLHVVCAKGNGTGPSASRSQPSILQSMQELRRGSMLVMPIPDEADLPALTRVVFMNNGFLPRQIAPSELPKAIEHVVVIVKEGRSFDEILGDIETASNGKVNGLPLLARLGTRGIVNQRKGELQTRLGLRNLNITPNHHEIAARFAFSDNFYASGEVSLDGHHWLAGAYPDAWTELSLMAAYAGEKDARLTSTAPGRLVFPQSNTAVQPEQYPEHGTLWHHLERHGVTFRSFGGGLEVAGRLSGGILTNAPVPAPLLANISRSYPGFDLAIPDQQRAAAFIQEIEEMYAKPGRELPRFLYIHLPNDHIGKPRPEDGYPFEASFIADNDLALGRIVEYLSSSKWWPKMAIFVTEDDAQGGLDHIDTHRTVMLAVSPYAKRNFVSHVNTSFPGLLKTVFGLLRIPSLNLYDATAAGLEHCFTSEPDLTPYKALPVPKELFDPGTARAATSPDQTTRR
jgi:DNA-binding beta-propeller fold protein YncE